MAPSNVLIHPAAANAALEAVGADRVATDRVAALEGSLTEVPLAVVLQMIAYAGRTATLLFSDEGRPAVSAAAPRAWTPSRLASAGVWGVVMVRSGQFLEAVYGEHRGFEAVMRLALRKVGRFDVRFDEALLPLAADVTATPVDGLLLQAMVAIDEGRRLVSALSDLDEPLGTRATVRCSTGRDFLLGWPGPFLEGARALSTALRAGQLKVASA